MKHLLLAAGAALALGTAVWAAAPGEGTSTPSCDAATTACPTQEHGPYRRVDLQPGDCGAAGLDCALTQFGPFRRV